MFNIFTHIPSLELVQVIVIDIYRTRPLRTHIFTLFFPRTVRHGNSLPAEIVESNSIVHFKSELFNYLVNNQNKINVYFICI